MTVTNVWQPLRPVDLYGGPTFDELIAKADKRGELNSIAGHHEELTTSQTASPEATSAGEHEGPSA